MWPMAIAGIIGTGASLFSGMSQGDAAKKARADAMEMFRRNQQVAESLKTRQEAMVDRPLREKLQELQSSNLTAEGQQGLNRFNEGASQVERQINENAPQTGYGVAGARALNAKFQRASGIAGIHLDDQARKDREIGGFIGMGQQTPGWAQIAAGSNTQMGNYQANLAEQGTQASNSSYGAAAQGLTNLAMLYSMQNKRQPSTFNDDTSGTSENGADLESWGSGLTLTQLRSAGLI